MRYYIVPDVHGRLFYQDPIKQALSEKDSHIVFLGDYIDPYPHEHITPDEAFERFKDIISLKKLNPNKITLLIGNHDLHYIDGSRRGCRMDYRNKSEIVSLFKNNIELFEYVKFITVNEKNFILSHAGFHYNWIREYSDKLGMFREDWEDFSEEKCIDFFNFSFLSSFDWNEMSKDPKWLFRYGDASYARGGYGNHPSFLWSDLSDHIFEHVKVRDCEQIFGHTMQQVGNYVRFDNCYCIDCQCVFILGEDGILKTFSGNELINNGENVKNVYLDYFSMVI